MIGEPRKPLIVFVDDEPTSAQAYIRRLQVRYRVEYLQTASATLPFLMGLRKLGESYRALVLDVMMPTPDGVHGAHEGDGVRTGIWILEQIQARKRDKPADLEWPRHVAILTNRDPDGVAEDLVARDVDFREYMKIFPKPITEARLFPERLDEWLSTKV